MMSDDTINTRKTEHINIVDKAHGIDRKKAYFDLIRLHHRALPEIDYSGVDPSLSIMGKQLSFPLLISSMTGGENSLIEKINMNLALAAQETNVAMAAGSLRVIFDNPKAEKSFHIRQYAPDTLLFSNIGAIQLNCELNTDSCKKAIDVVGADGIFLHLNPLQEVIQPEGDTNFRGLADKIGNVVRELDSNVIVKEVGSGMSCSDVELLISQNVKYIDVAGSGGTSWSRIEHFRQPGDDGNSLGITFEDWGIPTPESLTQLNKYKDKITLFGSGGLRNGIDMVKAVILGASLCGIASPFLRPAMNSCEDVIKVIEQFKLEFKTTMFLLGIDNFKDLMGNQSLISQSYY